MAHILIVGLGELGSALSKELLNQGHRVSGIRRGSDAPVGVELFAQDLLTAPEVQLPTTRVDVMYLIVTPGERSQSAYEDAFLRLPKRLFQAYQAQHGQLPPVVFVSSTAVYGQSEAPVDEKSATNPSGFNGEVLLQAEQNIQALSPATVVRFSGIYGPGRESRIRLARELLAGGGNAPKAQWSSRIHSADAVGLLLHLGECWLAGNAPPQVVVGSDMEPVVNLEVLNWLAQQLGGKLDLQWQQVDGRAVNSRYLAAGNYALQYPSFREGYNAILAASSAP